MDGLSVVGAGPEETPYGGVELHLGLLPQRSHARFSLRRAGGGGGQGQGKAGVAKLALQLTLWGRATRGL